MAKKANIVLYLPSCQCVTRKELATWISKEYICNRIYIDSSLQILASLSAKNGIIKMAKGMLNQEPE